jgi:PAS domain S-box-containing protein
MNSFSTIDPTRGGDFQLAWEDNERAYLRGWRDDAGGDHKAVLAVVSGPETSGPGSVDRLVREYELREELNGAWAARPLELLREGGRTILILEDPGGEPLDGLLALPMELRDFLRLAVELSGAIGMLHDRGIIHKDIKPANVLVNQATGQVWLTGFGIASRLLRQRQMPDSPEVIAGTLAYMAPEQTGRMNRSIDSRSDLYALGVTLYQMLTGILPFSASDPMEWVHCHIARQPVSPNERSSKVPAPVSAIVMKLLAKMAEDRYQTAVGAESDLRRCQAAWESYGWIDAFSLGENDTSDRLSIPEKLYGRERDIDALLTSFDRVVASGRPELVLVSGYSGIGKSSVVNEVHKVLVPPRGLFASGKFDQFKRDIPYAALAQAFKSLVASLLSKSDAELQNWRAALCEALGPNGLLIVDLVPELKLIIGDQLSVQELPAQDAQRRFQLVIRRFIEVFAQPEHPLALFLDDLQWLDTATLDLLEDLLTQETARHLLLICAYRNNEVDPGHPLMRKLESIRQTNALMKEIVLSPLAAEHLELLVADSLHCETERVIPLARLIHSKTAGNPFFSIQFMSALFEEGLLTFEHRNARWSWDLNRIHAKGYTDNVVDLMVGKLNRLPLETQKVLEQLACLGNVADNNLLCIVCEKSEEEVQRDLWEATRLEYVVELEGAYKFVHDRVQEAIYSLIPEERLAEAHLRIGRLLIARTPSERQEETIFEIVSQFNRGTALIVSPEEREQVAKLNLVAGRRAKTSTAYDSALNYFSVGSVLLMEDHWTRLYDLAFALELNRAECELLTGHHEAAEERLSALAHRAALQQDRAAVTCLKVELYTIQDQSERAVAVCLEYLREEGIEWSAHPTDQNVRREYDQLWHQIGSRSIEELVDLPVMNDLSARGTMDVLTRLFSAANCTDENLSLLVATHMASRSLGDGNMHASCCGYAWLAMMAGAIFGDYSSTRRFGQLSIDLVEKRGLASFAARVYVTVGCVVVPWVQRISAGQRFLQRALDVAAKSGDLTYSAYAFSNLVSNFLACGQPLNQIEDAALTGIGFAQTARFGLVVDMIATQIQLIRTLRGLTREFGAFNDATFDEGVFEQRLEANPSLKFAACRYWIRKMLARVWAHDHAAALVAAAKAHALLWTLRAFIEHAEYHFYAALARAASCNGVSAETSAPHFTALVEHHRQLEKWAEVCFENFADRSALVGAEIARLEAREFDAARLYERAICLAREQGFLQNEGLAYELASRFYAARGFEAFADTYLRAARQCYSRWGALGKVQQLDQLYPQIREEVSPLAPTSTIAAPVDQLDLATVLTVSQAVSREMDLKKLIDSLMRTAIEHAGAERGLMLLSRATEHRIEAEAMSRGAKVIVQLHDVTRAPPALPESIVQYVVRTQEYMILDDALVQNQFSSDAYILEHRPRSILCVPLLNQGKLIGILYLENNLAPHVFTPARIAVLKLLASQAAISLENAHLYRDLEDRETRIRRLVDANIIGIFVWDLRGQIIEANGAFLRLLGYEHDDLISGRIRRTDLTPAEWRVDDERAIAAMKGTGTVQPYESEFLRKNGDRVPVLIGAAAFDERGDQGVAFVLDLTERKQAEKEARESERRYGEMQTELAHANRVAAVGQLSASIAHEVSQPIGAAAANAHAALRWLGRQPPNVEQALEALDGIAKDTERAGEIIGRISALVTKAPQRKERFEINEAIREVIMLAQGELRKNGISVAIALGESLPRVDGDRIQLQQVILNLINNAVQAMSAAEVESRELVIFTSESNRDGIVVAVRDSGPGLDPANLERIFKPFYTTKPGGLGMGLSICRSIIESHGGRLWASANMPRGTTFQFTIPVQGGGAAEAT